MFNLLEILISFFLLSILLLGVDAINLLGIKQSKKIYYVSVAYNQLNGLIERLQIAKGYQFNQIIDRWNQQNEIALPHGWGTVTKKNLSFNITIFWGSVSHQTCPTLILGESGCIFLQITI